MFIAEYTIRTHSVRVIKGTRASGLMLELIRTRTRTYILFCDKTRVPIFYSAIKHEYRYFIFIS